MLNWFQQLVAPQLRPQPLPTAEQLRQQAEQLRLAAAGAFESGILQPGQVQNLAGQLQTDAFTYGARAVLEQGTPGAGGPAGSLAQQFRVGIAMQSLGLVEQALSDPSSLYRAQVQAQQVGVAPPPTAMHAAIATLPPPQQANLIETLARTAAETGDWFSFACLTEATRRLDSWSAISTLYDRSAPNQVAGKVNPNTFSPGLAKEVLPGLTGSLADVTSRRITFLGRLAGVLNAEGRGEEAKGLDGFQQVLGTELATLKASSAPGAQLTSAGVLAGLNSQVNDWIRASVGMPLLMRAMVGTTAEERLLVLEETAQASNLGLAPVRRAREAFAKGDVAQARATLLEMQVASQTLLQTTQGPSAADAYGALFNQLRLTLELLPDPNPPR